MDETLLPFFFFFFWGVGAEVVGDGDGTEVGSRVERLMDVDSNDRDSATRTASRIVVSSIVVSSTFRS